MQNKIYAKHRQYINLAWNCFVENTENKHNGDMQEAIRLFLKAVEQNLYEDNIPDYKFNPKHSFIK